MHPVRLDSPLRIRLSSLLKFTRVHGGTHGGFVALQSTRSYAAQGKPLTKSFAYQLSAAFSAKQERLDLVQNCFHLDESENILSSVTPDIDRLSPGERRRKRWNSGQDAFFLSQIPYDKSIAFAVVDGVGGWMDSGVDPADYSHRLCELMSAEATRKKNKKSTVQCPRPGDVLQIAHGRLDKDDSVIAGGSTACVGTVWSDGMMEIVNLGDSGYVLFSPFRVKGLSTAQTHGFNTPYQLAKIPRSMRQQMRLFGSDHLDDMPRQSDVYKHQLRHGDVFVLATDGVFDNLSPEEILRIVSAIMLKTGAWNLDGDGTAASASSILDSNTATDISGKGVKLSQMIAMTLVHQAKVCGWDARRDGPFAKEYRKHYPMDAFKGGKQDDICVIAGIALQNE